MIGTNAFNSTHCKNCGGQLTDKELEVTDEDRRLYSVHRRFQRVHVTNREWNCPNETGLNPHSDEFMPVTFVTVEGP